MLLNLLANTVIICLQNHDILSSKISIYVIIHEEAYDGSALVTNNIQVNKLRLQFRRLVTSLTIILKENKKDLFSHSDFVLHLYC